jgi:hypothetical protein
MEGVTILNIHDKKTREVQEWNKMKLIGKRKYIWLNGVFKWGLLMAISVTFVWQGIDEGFTLDSFSNQNFVRRLIISLILFPIGGYIQSAFLWRKYNKKYNTY